MIPWIQIYSNLPRHPKVTRLADALSLASQAVNPNVMAAGLLVSLWSWASQNAVDGDLSRCTPRAVADACQWKRRPEALLEGLRAAGFLDPDGRLHDWDEHERLYLDAVARKRELTRLRVQRYRERASCNAKNGVTGVTCNAPIPDQTETEQNDCLLPEERKRKERSAFASEFYAGCAGPLLRAKAVIAVFEARRARERGDEAEAARWIGVAELGGLTVDAETLEYEG